jgi:hypothetical protein
MRLRKILLAIGVTDTIVNNLKNTVTAVITDNEIMIDLKIVQDSNNCNKRKKGLYRGWRTIWEQIFLYNERLLVAYHL